MIQRGPTAIEMELMSEDEVARLQREYRNLAIDRYKGQNVMRMSTRKYKEVIPSLLREQQNLMIDLNVAASDYNRHIDDETIKELRDLVHEYTKFKDQIVMTKKYSQDLQDQIQKINRKIIETKLKSDASDARYEQRIQLMQNNIIKLENRLEMQVNRFSCILKENVKLREEIEFLTKERERFNTNWAKFFHILELSKKFMHDLIQQTMLVYNEREELRQKIELLTQKARMDIQQHAEGLIEMNRFIDSRNELHHFLENKLQRRIALGAMKKAELRQQKNEIEVGRKREVFAKILADIQEYADSANIDDIQREFLQRDEETFSMFTILNNIHLESERIADNIQYLRFKSEEKQVVKKSRDMNQKKTLDKLRMYLQVAVDEVGNHRVKLTAQNDTISALFRGISSLCATIQWDPQKLQQHLLGQFVRQKIINEDQSHRVMSDKSDKTGIILDIHNIHFFLGELETWVINAMKNALIYQKTTGATKQIVQITALKVNSFKIEDIETPCPLCIEESRSILCPVVFTTAWTRSSIVKMSARQSAEYHIMQASLHTVSKCKMPLMMKKRYLEE